MEFRILGSLEVVGEHGELALGALKPRAVLAVLLLHRNRPVSADRLAVALWGEEAPGDAIRTVQVYVSRLRRALGDPQAIATTPAGYRLGVRPGELDADRFERGVEAGRRALTDGEHERASGLLRAALGLWRGPALAELEFEAFAQGEIARLQEMRLAALEARVDADLAVGRHAALIGELQGLVAEQPTRERFAAALMLALYRNGRQAEALEVYRDTRDVLVEQAGIEPGLELQQLHRAVLNQDASLELPVPGEQSRERDDRPEGPLIGREAELVRLREQWQAACRGSRRLVLVSGAESVGKTRLAAELAAEVEQAGGAVEYVAAGGSPGAIARVLGALRESPRATLVVLDDADDARDALLAALGAWVQASAGDAALVVVCSRDHDALAGITMDETLVLARLPAQAAREIASEANAEPLGSEPGNRVGEPPTRRSGLPRPPNRTIGRAREISAVAERLRSGQVPLLTLTGPGGVGKTRLALEAARAIEPDFADGAGFVSLAALERSEHVAGEIVSALSVVAATGESPEEAVERFLAVKHLLLVVDNCEHLPAATPLIGRLAAAGPGVTVLATSREPLAVHAEQIFRVPPLAMPDFAANGDLDGVLGADAVALFCERARAHDAAFQLDDGNATAVVQICQRLDGLPLAIELAAARCALLAPSEIAARLGAALSGLGGGPRDAPARQRTLRATLDWSHELLDDDEQACFARLAALAGGASVDAAEAIAGADVDTLDRLVAKSLLVRRQGRYAPTRLVMLETVRAYAGERFAALPDREAVRERHFDFFLRVAGEHGALSALDGPDARRHLACLDDEFENFRAALRWAAERHAAERILELSSALVDYWQRRDRHAEAADWILPALRQTAATADPGLRCRALSKAVWPLWDLGRRDEVLALLAQAEPLARTIPNPHIRAEVLHSCAAIQALAGRCDEASRTADEALATARACGDTWMVAMAAWARALAADGAEDFRARVEEAETLLAGVGNAYHLQALLYLAVTSCWRTGRDADALIYLDRAVPLARRLPQPSRWMGMLDLVGLAALLRGDIAAADEAFREALTLSQDLAFGPRPVALVGLAAVAAAQDQPERAARLAGAVAAHHDGADEDVVARRLEVTFLEPARLRYGPGTWETVARHGAELNLQEATVYALDQPPVPARRPRTTTPAPTGHAG